MFGTCLVHTIAAVYIRRFEYMACTPAVHSYTQCSGYLAVCDLLIIDLN